MPTSERRDDVPGVVAPTFGDHAQREVRSCAPQLHRPQPRRQPSAVPPPSASNALAARQNASHPGRFRAQRKGPAKREMSMTSHCGRAADTLISAQGVARAQPSPASASRPSTLGHQRIEDHPPAPRSRYRGKATRSRARRCARWRHHAPAHPSRAASAYSGVGVRRRSAVGPARPARRLRSGGPGTASTACERWRRPATEIPAAQLRAAASGRRVAALGTRKIRRR